MDQPQTKPVSKRRTRKLIITSLLVLAIGVPWWFWPRADQRLVGKWTSGNSVFEFHDDGRLDVRTTYREKYEFGPEVVRKVTEHYGWYVIGNRFFQVREEPLSASRVLENIRRLWMVLRGQVATDKVVIDHVEANQIRLRRIYPGPFHPSHLIEFTRVSE